ncbi:MAG: hypothetical protein HKN87_17995 [Saprospiraceae bacterium]|nr:hypothetical protein [Saprospiraceae bacterium]
MPISTTDQLFNLIKGLSKSEKRNFKLYAKRTRSASDTKFIRLFDAIDSMEEYDEEEVFRKFRGVSKGQLSNLKRHLYTELLSSLRIIHKKKSIDIKIREQIDFARILYGKGLYMQSLKLLSRIKGIAKESNQDILHYEILEFEKLIEEKHITRSRKIKNKVEDLIYESEERNRILNNTNRLTNLKLKIHGLYIKVGHAKDEKDAFVVRDYFKSNLPDMSSSNMTFFERVYLHQSYVWYYYILLDFEKCAEHAHHWVSLYESKEIMVDEDPDIYMRGIHYLLTSLYGLGKVDTYLKYVRKFESFHEAHKSDLNLTSRIIYFLYYYSALIHKHYLQGTFSEGLELVPAIQQNIELYRRNIDVHRILVFNYRIAWLNFGEGRFSEAIDYLNEIINLKAGHLREDIQSYARLLHLLAHYELENYSLLEYLERSVSRFFEKIEDKNKVQGELLSFIRRQLKSRNIPDFALLEKTKKQLDKFKQDPYEKRAFLYLDAGDWVTGKLEGLTVSEVIRKRRGT